MSDSSSLHDQTLPSLSGPTAPGEEESQLYYAGLPSRPTLVARTSTEPWRHRTDGGWPVYKTLEPVGQHPIVSLWNQSSGPLRYRILGAIDALQWTAVDILRLGYERNTNNSDVPLDNPVTLLVSVEPGSTSWSIGLSVALECRHVLGEFEIFDIEVEIKESIATPAALPGRAPSIAPKLTSPTISIGIDLNSQAVLLTESLGVSMASLQNPFTEGTKGIYLRMLNSNRILLLTCRHMVFDKSVENADYHHLEHAPWAVIQPGSGTLSSANCDIADNIRECEQSMELWESLGGEQALRQVHSLRADKSAMVELQGKLAGLQDPVSRIFGHVLFSPKLGVGTSESGAQRLRDWAIIELHQDKHKTPLYDLRNSLMLGPTVHDILHKARKWDLSVRDLEQFQSRLLLTKDTHTLYLTGILPEREMRTPDYESATLDKPSILVAKYGRTTQLTAGVANEVKSVRREPFQGQSYQSEEWCILGAKPYGKLREAFSAKGDSGSCVWDMRGRVCALLTGGIEKGSGQLDTTYAAPVEWLLEDIRAHGFDVELV